MTKISDKDKLDWQKFINSKDKIQDKDTKSIQNDISFKERTIDLHGYSLDFANAEIEKFILSCCKNGIRKISIITGKGSRSKNKEDPYQSKDLSILKYSIPNFIKKNKTLTDKILKIDFDSVEDPNKGSFDITLKKND